ncbi:flagellar protein FliS [Geothermobacter ehrlichii]|uniref:Flagellar secretion chaperone FliS n=1 Tax=Geothermobacter ehrlichii TaxID=213224 RepID=A0A5D3WMT9_9BACT|nr:flagellar export chaperone FliS [Geothermobacter ehrlichii]TYP00171.1 flagellar protein FliS [Geothermobacter ehrlichii]
MNAFWNQYQQNQVNQAPPEQILIMLYDAAIRHTVRAIKGLANRDMVAKAEGISKAMHIITTFSDTLDHQIGGEIAENLDALYNFMVRELSRANLNNDPAPLKNVESLLRELRATWTEAIEAYQQQQAEKRAERAGKNAAAGYAQMMP